MRIAIVGTGIAGLTAAHRLREAHDVVLFEAGPWVGGHTHTVDVTVGGREFAVDTGFIVFNQQNYPLFTALLDELGVPSQPTTMSFSVRCERTGLEYGSASLSTVFADRRNLIRPAFLGMLNDIRRFHREAGSGTLPDDTETVGEYVHGRRYGQPFIDHYLVPLGSSLWSSPPHQFLKFPMRFVIEFLGNHAMLQMGGQPIWRVVAGGSRRYVERLTQGWEDRLHLNTPVKRIERQPAGVRLVDAHGGEGTFDHVVLACHADQALTMLAEPTPVERELLEMFPYQANDIVVHTDESVLPKNRRAWSSWNYHVPAVDRDLVSVTYNMNRLQSLDSSSVINVTLNDSGTIRSEHVLGHFVYEHPVFLPGRDHAQRRHHEIAAANRTSFCGAYWGFGFHEDGVRSGTAVADAIRALPSR